MFYLFSPQAISNLIASDSLLSKKMLHLNVLVHIVHFSFWYISRRYICKKYYLIFGLFWLEWFTEELNLAASPWQYMTVSITPTVPLENVNCLIVSESLWPHGLYPARLLCQWKSPGKNSEVGCRSLSDPRIGPRSPTLWADLLSEPPGKLHGSISAWHCPKW